MFFPALAIALTLGTAPPDFVRTTRAPDLPSLFGNGHQPVSQLRLDVSDDPGVEWVVLVGRPGPTGALYPTGLVVLSQRSGEYRVMAATELALNAAYDAKLGREPDELVDLDGDGHPEIPLHTRAAGGTVTSLATTWWRFDGTALHPAYHLQREWRTRHGSSLRSMALTSPGTLVETVERDRRAGDPERLRVTLHFDRLLGRFVPVRTVRESGG